jgi:hypothetical protein
MARGERRGREGEGARHGVNWPKGAGAFLLRGGQTRDDTTRFCGNTGKAVDRDGQKGSEPRPTALPSRGVRG